MRADGGKESVCGEFNMHELNDALRQCKNGGAAGCDSIPYEFLKWAPKVFKRDLLKLFNKILDTGDIPTPWHYAIIAALYKKGDPFQPVNYRPIVLRSCVAKLFELMILTRMRNKVDNGWNEG